jgi:HEAT repeat protein
MPLTDIFVEPHVVMTSAPRSQKKEELPVSATKVLAKEQALAILGEPGQGKSTLLKTYASELSADENRSRLPMLIELAERREKVDEPQDFGWLWERIPTPIRNELGQQDLRDLAAALAAGRVAVLLDGLDELSKTAKEQVLSLVGGLVESGNQVVITSRPHVYWSAPIGGFAIRRLAELNDSQIQLLAGRVCEALAPEFGCQDASRALAAVLRAARGEGAAVAKNPLFLSFMCLSSVQRVADQREDELPNRPVALIGECLDVLVAWHKRPPRAWPDALSAERIVRILGPLALLSLGSDGTIRQSHVVDLGVDDKAVFHQHLLPARLIEQHGGQFAFPTGMEAFREYFTAQAIARDDDPYKLLRSHLHDPAWRQVIGYAAGCLDNVEAWAIDLALPFATWFGVKAVNVFVALTPGLIKLIGKPYEPVAEGVKEIAKEVGPKLQTPLEKKLKDSRRSVEYLVTRIMRQGSAYEEILGRDLRLAADCLANAIGCTDRLAGRFLDSVVGMLVASPPCLIEVLHSVRPQGALVGEAIQKRMGALAAHDDIWVRELALRVSQGEVRVERLIAAVRNPDGHMRFTASSALEKMPKDAGLKSQLLPLAKRPDGRARLPEASEEERNQILASPEPESNWSLREAAARALGGVSDDVEIRRCLLELLHDPIGPVRQAAGFALSVDDPVVRRELLALTRHADSSVRYDGALLVWRAQAYPEVRERLLELTYDNDYQVRYIAVRELDKAVGEARIRARLLEMLQNPSESGDVVARVVETLAQDVSNPEVRDAVLSRVHDDDSRVQVSALRAALRQAAFNDAACERLLEMTRDPNELVRRQAVKAIASEVSIPRVKSRLIALTTDPDDSVRRASMELLQGIVSDPEIVAKFRELIEGSDHDLYWLAIESLLERGALDVSRIVDRASKRVVLRLWAVDPVPIFERLVMAHEMRKRGSWSGRNSRKKMNS